MSMNIRDRIINRALLCLSESINDGTNFVEQDSFPIEQFVDEAGRRVIMLAPLRTLGEGNNTKAPTSKSFENGVYTVTLPEGFARLITFKLSSWKRSVREVIYDTDPTYAWQLHPATRGGEEKPVVAITRGGTELEAYSSNSNVAAIVDFACIIYNDANDVPEKLAEATAWMTASLYLASMGELDMSKVLESKSIELLQLV